MGEECWRNPQQNPVCDAFGGGAESKHCKKEFIQLVPVWCGAGQGAFKLPQLYLEFGTDGMVCVLVLVGLWR